jgi:predicted TIM-barrel fold metal-dependent hydrolase
MTERPQPGPSKKRPVSPPKKPLPAGAWDCHAHVFGPFDRFPLIPDRRHEPPLATAEDYLAMLDGAGFERGVLVHGSAKGFNPANVADALARRPDRLTGVAVVPATTSDAAFAKLHDAGFRGLRFTEAGRHVKGQPGTLYFEDLEKLAPRLREMGWHADIWGRCDLVMPHARAIAGYGIPVIFDHLANPVAANGAGDPVFRSLLDWLAGGDFWVKSTAIRVSRTPPDYAEVRPFHEAILERIPDRFVFGSDWPYISLDDDPPDVGRLIDLMDRWVDDDALRQRIFVDNPRAFYLR